MAKASLYHVGQISLYFFNDPRKEKRAERKAGVSHPVYQAYQEGEALAIFGEQGLPPRLRQNPYPPGLRHRAWQSGYDNADPMGVHHGINE